MRYSGGHLVVPPSVTARPVKEDLVLVDLDRGEYFSLNESGRAIWEGIGEVEDLDELIMRLQSDFEEDPENIREDVEQLIAELLDRQLLLLGRP
ncbi:MAG: PqqD family protein [Thermoanaerobaculia bacterium]|nr:PqqD family protein [Thermoanaerobaculia bacterium]